jgi:hypothetical protein
MWHTPLGDRIVKGAEADLIRASVESMVCDIREQGWDASEFGFESGIELFDELTWPQKLAGIEQVARYLLTQTPESLDLHASNEAVVGALFENIRQNIEAEIFHQSLGNDMLDQHHADAFYWRGKVLAAEIESTSEAERLELQQDGFSLPTTDCECLSTWEMLVEGLADQILWDRDYEMAAAFMDDDPDFSANEKRMFGIDQDYFTGLTPDPREDQLDSVVFSIERLIRSKPR